MDFKSHTTLGRTGLSVSRLGIGTYGAPADALERAFHEYGINYFYLYSVFVSSTDVHRKSAITWIWIKADVIDSQVTHFVSTNFFLV